MLDKSRKLKTEAIIASITGPIFTGIGLHLLRKEDDISISGNGGWISVSTSPSSSRVFGAILTSAGAVATISILPLFISSAKMKKKADLILVNESTSLLQSRINIQGVGIRLNF